jgi:multidrug efflux pump
MAVAIMGGLAIATILTVLFLPALYAAWFGVKMPAKKDLSYNHSTLLKD